MKKNERSFIMSFKNDFPYICAMAVIFSFMGWIVENVARAISYGIIDNRFHILTFIPVYGLIAFAAYIFGNPNKLSFFGYQIIKKDGLPSKIISNLLLLLICIFLVFVGELSVGNLYEKLFGAVLWNYESHFMHLTKYVSLLSALGFGVGAYFIIRFFYYPLFNVIKKKTSSRNATIYPIIYMILLVDMIFMIITTAICGKGPTYWQIYIYEGLSIPAVICGILFSSFSVFLTIFLITSILYMKASEKVFTSQQRKTKFAILIPARNESRVIDTTLLALTNSNYPKEYFDVYVMVSDENDPTLKICDKYNNVISSVRKTTTIGKGYVLDEMIKNILSSEKSYDAYLLLDADNLVDADFLSNMSNAFQMNYDIVVGNRMNKNPNTSATSGASGITFTIINHMNSMKSNNNEMVLLTGTGFCIKSSIINQDGGWPFHSLTEDYELSMYAKKNKLTSAYVKNALFYDEQPIKLSDSIKQRTRWIKGFMTNNKDKDTITLSKLSGFGTVISYVLFLLFNLLISIFELIKYKSFESFNVVLISLISYYIVVVGLSLVVLFVDRKNSKMTVGNIIKSSLFHPLFLATYFVSLMRIFKKGKEWEVIPHSIN